MNSEERAARAAAKQRRATALGARLRILRADRGLSQTRLARMAGVPRQLLSMLEHGRRPRPEAGTLEKLAAALGVRVEQLRGREPLRELAALDEGHRAEAPAPAPEAPPPEPPGAPAVPDYVTSLGLLPVLPPGTTVIQRRNPDGSVEVYLHIPGPCEPRAEPDNPDATGSG